MKRFTDTNRFDEEWYSELPCEMKCAYELMWASADNSGVWSVNRKLAEFKIGKKVNWEEFLKRTEGRVIILNESEWMLPGFVEMTCGELSTACRPHRVVIDLLRRRGLLNDSLPDRLSIDYPKGSLLPLNTIPVQVTVTVPVSVPKGVQGEPVLPVDLNTPEFTAEWARYVEYRRARKLSPLLPVSVQAQWAEMATWGHPAALLAINQTIANGYQGIFPPKANHSPTSDREKKKANEYPLRGSGPPVYDVDAEIAAEEAAEAAKLQNGTA